LPKFIERAATARSSPRMAKGSMPNCPGPTREKAQFQQPRSRGRPTKFDPNKHITEANRLGLLGATDEEMAAFWEITPSAFNLWIRSVHMRFEFSCFRRRR
jgi:hypothetical protein